MPRRPTRIFLPCLGDPQQEGGWENRGQNTEVKEVLRLTLEGGGVLRSCGILEQVHQAYRGRELSRLWCS